jgi:glutathione-regulated potassium-efflux system ancillary protein KefG
MNKILINFAHPSRANSKINNALRKAVEDLECVTINDLYANYPDFLIDVKREQQLCLEHDVIIFQHPFYWYSYPAIVKEWMDLVLQHGWAYGSEAHGLQDKLVLQAITAGGEDSSYQKHGFNEYTIKELTYSFKAMAKLCKMKWLPPFTVLGIHRGLPIEKINFHAEEYRRVISALRDNHFDLKKAQKKQYLNSNLDACIRRP